MAAIRCLGVISLLISGVMSIGFIRVPLKKMVDETAARILHEALARGALNRTGSSLEDKFQDDKYLQYYGSIEIGNPPQKFNAHFNPAVRLTKIPSNKLKRYCGGGFKSFDELSSHTFGQLGETITVDEGSVTLKVDKDVFRIGNLTIENQYFGLVHEGPCENDVVYNGVVGLGFSSNYLTLLDNMLQQKLINQSVIGLYLDRNLKTAFGGEVAFGHWNPKFVKKPHSVEYFPIVMNGNPPSWQIHIINSVIGTTQISFDRIANIDTKSYFIDLPMNEADTVSNVIGALNFKGNFIVECKTVNKLPSLVINIHHQEFYLNASDYVDTVHSYNGYCTVLIRSTNQTTWTLGGAFLGKYYTIFNYKAKRIAFGELLPSSASSIYLTFYFFSTVLLIALNLKFF